MCAGLPQVVGVELQKSVKGKSAEQCKKRYQLLVLDIASISSGEKIEVAYVH